uniref:Uncharacterized protein n=1 Tax=Leptosiphonia brodiei TaxID=2608611 RepID=A0A1Z1MAF1_9FLOR|nr:hypothetical protein [Leptosiphonia brodiei]ARW62862.1 hypothetical protein [Leptosiphonia brodiei]
MYSIERILMFQLLYFLAGLLASNYNIKDMYYEFITN